MNGFDKTYRTLIENAKKKMLQCGLKSQGSFQIMGEVNRCKEASPEESIQSTRGGTSSRRNTGKWDQFHLPLIIAIVFVSDATFRKRSSCPATALSF
jgi:hypothetical protein